MRHRLKPAVILVVSACLSLPAAAQERQQESAPSDEIVVNGVRDSTLDLSRLLKAQEVYNAGRETFAPSSSLHFRLRPAAGVALDGLTLTLVNRDQRIPVPVDGEGRFALTNVPPGKWELVHNRGAGRIAVRVSVLSSGATELERPLGDLRLQCRVQWELAKANYSFVARAGFNALGGCSSPNIAIFFSTPGTIRTATVSAGSRTEELPLNESRSAYRPPLGKTDWAHDAIVRVSME